MYQFLTKNGQLIALVTGVLVIAIFMITALAGLGDMGISMSTNLNDLDKEVVSEINAFNTGLYLTIVLAIIAAVAWLGFGLYSFVRNPKRALRAAIPFAVVVLLFVILGAVSQPEQGGAIYDTIQDFDVSDNTSKYISGALWTAIALLGLAVLSLLYSEVRNALK